MKIITRVKIVLHITDVFYNLANTTPFIVVKRKNYNIMNPRDFGFVFSSDVRRQKFIVCIGNVFTNTRLNSDEFPNSKVERFDSVDALCKVWDID